MAKTVLFTVLFWVGLVGLPGCDDCKCPDANSVNRYVDVDGVESGISRKSSATSDRSFVKAGDKVRWEELAYFSVGYITRTYGVHINQRKASISWGTAAYACDCVQPGYMGSQERLKHITVKTVFDFDANYPAGNALDEWVQVSTYPGDKPLSQYLSTRPFAYNEYTRLELSVNKAPSAKGPFALDVTVELDNGEVYTTRTPVIELI